MPRRQVQTDVTKRWASTGHIAAKGHRMVLDDEDAHMLHRAARQAAQKHGVFIMSVKVMPTPLREQSDDYGQELTIDNLRHRQGRPPQVQLQHACRLFLTSALVAPLHGLFAFLSVARFRRQTLELEQPMREAEHTCLFCWVTW